MQVPSCPDEINLTQTAIFYLLVRGYPAQLSTQEIYSQISQDPDAQRPDIRVVDALRQLQADQLVRRHGACWAATLAAVKAYALLES